MKEIILFDAGSDEGELVAEGEQFCFLFLQIKRPLNPTEAISRVAKVALLGDRCDVLMYVQVDMNDEATVHCVPTSELSEWSVR